LVCHFQVFPAEAYEALSEISGEGAEAAAPSLKAEVGQDLVGT
jgi:hypothetical protein